MCVNSEEEVGVCLLEDENGGMSLGKWERMISVGLLILGRR